MGKRGKTKSKGGSSNEMKRTFHVEDNDMMDDEVDACMFLSVSVSILVSQLCDA